MFVTYKPQDPADGDPGEWVFIPGRVRASEGQALLREFGQTSWDMFVQGVRQNDLHARRVLLWHLQRRAHPLMRFDATPDFFADEMTVEMSSAELAEMLDMARAGAMPSDQKAAVIAAFEAELETARKREEGSDLAGKAPTPTSSTEPTITG